MSTMLEQKDSSFRPQPNPAYYSDTPRVILRKLTGTGEESTAWHAQQ